ncbi:MAG TPA: GH116 family glycosyl hydrolase [Chitinispirillaceae bacterium]|nr:GH116 family glycosyl hydrolase [Chitinispirillaceae bacterium]
MSLDYDRDGIPEGRPGEVRNTYDNIPFAGVGAYDANLFVASVKAMIRMAELAGDISEKKRYEDLYEKAYEVYNTLWYETVDAKGNEMAYFITCSGVNGQGRCTDVFTDQIVGLWQWIAMGEKPFLSEDRMKRLLKTIYTNNSTPMGWATARKEDGSAVDSDQGKDVWIASNYVLAQMLSYYGMFDESKQIYKKMDEIIFEHGNSLNTAESVRPEYEKQPGEKKAQPHYIVASYPRPGAVYDTLYLDAIKKEWEITPDAQYIDTERLQSIRKGIFYLSADL